MECAINPDVCTPSEYTEAAAKYLVKHHEADIIAILDDMNISDAKHHSVSVNCLDLLQEKALSLR